MNTLWERAVSDLTLEQMNHHERPGVLPMAFSFGHFMRAQDQSIRPFLRETPLWLSGGCHSRAWPSIGIARGGSARDDKVGAGRSLDRVLTGGFPADYPLISPPSSRKTWPVTKSDSAAAR